MKTKISKWLALALAFCIMVSALPIIAIAEQSDLTDTTGETTTEISGSDLGEADLLEDSDLENDWDTGATNPDGSPITSDQGDVGAQISDPTAPVEEELPPPVLNSYTLTVDLNGGQVNGMIAAGWRQSEESSYRWSRTVTEETAGSGYTLTLNNVLGGLLPEAPYRAGYDFAGWDAGDATISMTGDTTVTAQWKETTYQVTFQGADNGTLWSVQVPYGATLWRESDAPWTEDGVIWDANNQAEVLLREQTVTVTRHTSGSEGTYYYTFTLEQVPYFTYGGAQPTLEHYTFLGWRQAGGSGYTVLNDTVFTPQFEAVSTYVFSIYYYYESGSRVGDLSPYTVTLYEEDIVEGKLTFEAEIPSISHTQAVIDQELPAGVTAKASPDGSATYTVNVAQAFGESQAATHFLAMKVIYEAAEIQYTVVYYQQKAGESEDYEPVHQQIGSATYGSVVELQDRPALSSGSFDGFELSAQSRDDVFNGVVLEEDRANVSFQGETATISVYYDRAYYFVYFQTGTPEVQMDPIRVRFGAGMPDLEEEIESLHRAGYTLAEESMTWHKMNEAGDLEEITKPQSMPAHDIYAVIHWEPNTASIRIVYWVESRNASSYQNAYTKEVTNVATESLLHVDLSGDVPTIREMDEDLVREGFLQLMEAQYGDTRYEEFFSYSAQETKKSPGNVANAVATGTGNVAEDAITGNSFDVKVNGDGSTTINVYYTRNLYTLEFVLGRTNATTGKYEVATYTPGDFSQGWTPTNIVSLSFQDFENGIQVSSSEETYGDMQVSKVYRITEQDARAAVGRLGKKNINGYTCDVYLLTARFGANIASLWPTSINLGEQQNTDRSYVSMGTNANSYYRNVYTGNSEQHNVLAAYSTMDLNIVAMGTTSDQWTATPDTSQREIAHQMIAYWAKPGFFDYYFLYETLDASIEATDADIKPFDAAKADRTLAKSGSDRYQEGELVSYNGKVYEFRTSDKLIQGSTHTNIGQNQPAKQGYISAGKRYTGAGDEKGAPADAAAGARQNIYFFYERERYTLDIQNVQGSYDLPPSIITAEFSCLDTYQQGAQTLQQLGWESIGAAGGTEQGKAIIRYGGSLAPIHEAEIIEWLTDPEKGNLSYPSQVAGENQHYFSHWYRNVQQNMIVEWETDNEMQSMQTNITLYAGWFAPRYTTTYVLNGGTWNAAEEVTYTLMAVTLEDGKIFLYYPHMTEDRGATLYWYEQTKAEDRLFVDTLYEATVGDLLEIDAGSSHWKFRSDLHSVDDLERDNIYEFGSRLVDHYYCYMGGNGLDTTYSHERYVNINSVVNTVLPEPAAPTRTGYRFLGWYYFDATEEGEKIYLSDVLSSQQGLASYDEGYVYLDAVGDAHLLHRDHIGLFYYTAQLGYRFSYENSASLVSASRQLRAAWESVADASAVIYHLVPVSAVGSLSGFTADGNAISLENAEKMTIGGTEYYVLAKDSSTYQDRFTGSTLQVNAWEKLTDNTGKVWLPLNATIALPLDASVPTVTNLADVTGCTYRMEKPDKPRTYTYYACLIYQETDQVAYRIYCIDLAAAVSMGWLSSYQDTFDRAAPPPENETFVLQYEDKTWVSAAEEGTIITESAPAISGHVVYLHNSQTLRLQAEGGTNNLYFYYVKDGSKISYQITFYLEHDGGYSQSNMVRFSDVPGISGEIIRLDQLLETYDLLLHQAVAYSGHENSGDPDLEALYERHQDMCITLVQGGQATVYTVDNSKTDTLDPTSIAALPLDYHLSHWSPTGSTMVLSDDSKIDVYLEQAQLQVLKVSTEGTPLSGAKFTLERLIQAEGGEIVYEGNTYMVDPDFTAQTAVSGADGRALFQNLSAWVGEDGTGYLYRLTETEAPAGYNRLENSLFVTAPYTVDGEVSYLVTYTVTNAGISYLPNAGSFGGIYLVMLLGGAMMAAALTAAAILTRRRPGR